MKKGLVLLFAALLVTGLPLSALAGTDVYHFKDEAVSFCQDYYLFDMIPGPAAEFNQDVTVCYVGTRQSTVRVKTNKDGSKDLGWNSVIHGTATIKALSGGGTNVMAAMTLRAPYVPAQEPSGEVLFEGNLQVEEVAQDDGINNPETDGACLQPDNKAMFGIRGGLGYAEYSCWNPANVDYLMHHWKINGNSVFFFKYTIKDGVHSFEDTRGVQWSSNWP
jgi:hypothetical protein